ncbi:type IV fimbrial biogenesis protein FimT [Natronospira proteinivora]|uniref:Type II secretion system protein H n=1 Tax=Natronospira proteinivora TaxID=1807133 RepID=A0ABT1G4K4_9GAMM|nr:GspH/FimT family pseudopilin [Natronospira proteinivora]MCP1726224.1 type IV fimbrial biogenesis protein FimT [Natronospira proteinivora]
MRYRMNGLTLLELLIVLAIAGLLFGLGTPRFSAWVDEHRQSAASNRLVGAIQYARQESLRSQLPVSLCPSRDGRHCLKDTDAWQYGWIIYRHQKHHGSNELLEADQILQVMNAAPEGLRANRQRFTLRTDGRRSTNGTFLVCPPGAQTATRAVVVNVTGRPRATRDPQRMPSADC